MSGIAHLSLVQIGLRICKNREQKGASRTGNHTEHRNTFPKGSQRHAAVERAKKYTSDYKIDYNNYLSVFQLLLIFQNVRIFNQNSDYNDILLARGGRIKKK